MRGSIGPVVKPAVNDRPDAAGRPAVLHVYPSFAPAGVPLRMARIINHLGARFCHTIVALDNRCGAAAEFAPGVDVTLLPAAPQIRGTLSAALAAARILQRRRPHLLITCNWGSIEWAIANRLLSIAPHIHLEAGFGKAEADAQIRRRVLCRRWALARSAAVIVPSRRLEELARNVWKLRAGLVTYVPNGVDLARFAAPARDAIPGFERRPGELVIGTVAPLRPEKNVGRLLRAFARLDDRIPSRLVIAGDGAERCALEQLANGLGVAGRVVFTGQVMPESVLGSFDVFALSSDTEQMPNALLEAMAAGRAVAAVDVGDVKAIVSDENRDFIVSRDDTAAFVAALERLLREDATRARLGRNNRERAGAEFSQERMFAAYSQILSVRT
jgi:glycosyltransferase involved in cell wall biosynthesis